MRTESAAGRNLRARELGAERFSRPRRNLPEGDRQHQRRARGIRPAPRRLRDVIPGALGLCAPLRHGAGAVNLYRYVFNAPTNFTDPSGNIPIIAFVAAGAIAGWWLLGPGASTANAPAPSQEILRPLPRSFLEDAVAGLPGALAGGGTALAEEAAVVVGGTILRRPRPGGAAAGRRPVHIDIGGEGRYPGAINVNPSTTTSTTGAAGRPIPNLVQATGERLPFATQSVDIITLENAPIRPATISEIARVIRPGGDIRLVGPATPEVLAAHQRIADAVGGRVFQTRIKVRSDVGEVVYTNIIVPAR